MVPVNVPLPGIESVWMEEPNQDEVVKVSPNPIRPVSLQEEGHLDTETQRGRGQCHVTRGKDWSSIASSQGMPQGLMATRSREGAGKDSPAKVSEGAWPGQHLDFRL